MMLDRMEGNAELKTSVQQMLATRRLTHSVLLVGEAGLGTGFAARCIAADYLYPAGGAAAEALLRGECCRAVAAAGLRSSPRAPVQGTQARQAVRLADAALQRLGAQVNPKVVLTVFAAKLRTL